MSSQFYECTDDVCWLQVHETSLSQKVQRLPQVFSKTSEHLLEYVLINSVSILHESVIYKLTL